MLLRFMMAVRNSTDGPAPGITVKSWRYVLLHGIRVPGLSVLANVGRHLFADRSDMQASVPRPHSEFAYAYVTFVFVVARRMTTVVRPC